MSSRDALQLRVFNSFPCDVFSESCFRHSFVSLLSKFDQPFLSAIAVSMNGSVTLSDCAIIPVSDQLFISEEYPNISITDGISSIVIKFFSISSTEEFIRQLYSKIRDFCNTKTSLTQTYSYFQCNPPSPHPSTFCSHFRLSRTTSYSDPTAIEMLRQSQKLFRSETSLSVYTVTWNVDEKHPPEDLIKLIGSEYSQHDIYAFAFEEVDMSADSVIRGISSRREEWDSALMKAISTQLQYRLLCSIQCGTVYLGVFVKAQSFSMFSHVSSSNVVLGSMGFQNKAAVGIRFDVQDTFVCFVAAHLTQGRKNVERRNAEISRVHSEMTFFDSGRDVHINDHDFIVFAGDFNYRLSIPDTESRPKFDCPEFLWKYEQLHEEMAQKRVFIDYEEATVTFRHTYKYNRGSETMDTTKKARGPAWCDRVLYKASGTFTPVSYTSIPSLTMSDHRPVALNALMTVWTTDVAKAEKLYGEVLSTMQNLIWAIEVGSESLDFETVRLMEAKTRQITLKNEGNVAALFHVKSSEKWLTVEPKDGVVNPGKTKELTVTVNIKATLNTRKVLQSVQIDFPNQKPPLFFIVRANFLMSPVGLPLEYLTRLRCSLEDTDVSVLEQKKPGDINSAAIMDLPPAVEIPSEIWVLIDEIMRIGSDSELFFKSGESGEVFQIFECLRQRRLLDGKFSQHSVSEALVIFLKAMPEAIIPTESIDGMLAKGDTVCAQLDGIGAERRKLLAYITGFLRYLIKVVWVKSPSAQPVLDIFAPLIFRCGEAQAKSAKELLLNLIKNWEVVKEN